MAKRAYLQCWCICVLYAKPGGREALGKSQKQFASSCGPGCRGPQLSREGAESLQTLAGHPALLGHVRLCMFLGPPCPSLSKDPPITGLSTGICPLHTGAHITIHCLGNTAQIETSDLPIFLSCFFSFIQALCQQSQLPETSLVNLAGKALCADIIFPSPLSVHTVLATLTRTNAVGASTAARLLAASPKAVNLPQSCSAFFQGSFHRNTCFAQPNPERPSQLENTTESISRGRIHCKAGKLWWRAFHTYSFGFLKHVSFQG